MGKSHRTTRKHGQANGLRRKLSLAISVLSGRKVDAGEAALAHDCSRRTIFRDLKMFRDELEAVRRNEVVGAGVFSEEVLQFADRARSQKHYLASAAALAMLPTCIGGIEEQTRQEAFDWYAARLDEAHSRQLANKLRALRPLPSANASDGNRTKRIIRESIEAAEDGGSGIEVEYRVGGTLQKIRLNDLHVGQLTDKDWWLVAKAEGTGEPVQIQADTVQSVKVPNRTNQADGLAGNSRVDPSQSSLTGHHARESLRERQRP